MSFLEVVEKYSYESIINIIESATENKIESLLQKENITFTDFLFLLSKKGHLYLPQLAQKARDLTIKRFGKVINFYVPIYLSNECTNICVYCGYNKNRNIVRKTLTFKEIEEEYIKLKDIGFDNVLLLTGEDRKNANIEYLKKAVIMAKKYFTFVGLEIYPMSVEEYSILVKNGANGLTIYQETYHKDTYDKMHLAGIKKDYNWRLNTPERACMAGFRKVGLGALLGLFDWRYEATMLALHIDYLQKKYWRTEFTLGFPRINPPDNKFYIPFPVSDKEFVQLICALRLFLPEVGFLLTTRERPELRDNLIGVAITQISAGSKTNPGGYLSNEAGEQFYVADPRPLPEMIRVVRNKGYEPVLKDWEKEFLPAC